MESTVFALFALVLLRILTPAASQDCSVMRYCPFAVILVHLTATDTWSRLLPTGRQVKWWSSSVVERADPSPPIAVIAAKVIWCYSLRSLRWDVRLEISTQSEYWTNPHQLTCLTSAPEETASCVYTTVSSHPSFTIDSATDCARKCIILHTLYNWHVFNEKLNTQYVTAPVWWLVKVAVWPLLLSVVHSTTRLMAPAPHLVGKTIMPHLAVITPVVSGWPSFAGSLEDLVKFYWIWNASKNKLFLYL